MLLSSCHNDLILKQGMTDLGLCSGMKVLEKVEMSGKCKSYKDVKQRVGPVGDVLQSEDCERPVSMPRIQPPRSV